MGGDTNIGMYFDPTQKIDFKLLYNGDVLLEGYAKFLSTSYSTENKYYTISLFGRLGDIFQKLMSVVLSEEDNTLVIAGAGAGKTTTVAAKVRYLVEKRGIKPEQI